MVVNFTTPCDPEKQHITRALCTSASRVISLPQSLDIEFRKFTDGTWGGTHLHWKYRNRISINDTLSLQEIPIVLVHELIHCSQLHSGMLRVDHSGNVYWQGMRYETTNLSYNEYQRLPWELDVAYRLKKTLELIISP